MMVAWVCRYYDFRMQPHVSFELTRAFATAFFEQRQVLPVPSTAFATDVWVGHLQADQKFVVRRLHISSSVTTTSLWSGALWSEGSPF